MTKMRPVTARMTKGFCFFTRISERQLVFAQDHIPAMLWCQAWITAVRASTPGSGFVEDALVIGFVGGADGVGAEFFLGVDASGLTHGAAAVGAGDGFDRVACCVLYITGVQPKTIYTS